MEQILSYIDSFCNWKATMMVILLFVMALDYVSGVLVAWKLNNFKKQNAKKGAIRKMAMMIVVFTVYLACIAIPYFSEHISINVSWMDKLYPILVLSYLGLELRSILRNTEKMGAPVPSWLCKVLKSSTQLIELDHDDKKSSTE